jgi:hypothetical protein
MTGSRGPFLRSFLRRLPRLLLLVALVFPLAWYGPDDLRFLQGAIRVEGTVLAPEGEPGLLGGAPFVRIAIDIGGARYRYSAALYPFERPAAGAKVAALFNPGQRPFLKLDRPWHRHRVLGAWLLLAAVVLVLFLLRRHHRRRAGGSGGEA